eukprot:jgi/Hompol1/4251/HPOL_003546-RA
MSLESSDRVDPDANTVVTGTISEDDLTTDTLAEAVPPKKFVIVNVKTYERELRVADGMVIRFVPDKKACTAVCMLDATIGSRSDVLDDVNKAIWPTVAPDDQGIIKSVRNWAGRDDEYPPSNGTSIMIPQSTAWLDWIVGKAHVKMPLAEFDTASELDIVPDKVENTQTGLAVDGQVVRLLICMVALDDVLPKYSLLDDVSVSNPVPKISTIAAPVFGIVKGDIVAYENPQFPVPPHTPQPSTTVVPLMMPAQSRHVVPFPPHIPHASYDRLFTEFTQFPVQSVTNQVELVPGHTPRQSTVLTDVQAPHW